MKKILLLAMAFLLLAQAGCTKAVRYTEEEIKSFPTNVQDNIRKGQIDLGMSPEQVRYAWGNPDTIKFLDPFDGKPREEWLYSSPGTLGVVGTKILFFYNGKLLYIK
jgi:outer membrane protein assembly factor BamE (lipoprotein component of BamABCDE complex)